KRVWRFGIGAKPVVVRGSVVRVGRKTENHRLRRFACVAAAASRAAAKSTGVLRQNQVVSKVRIRGGSARCLPENGVVVEQNARSSAEPNRPSRRVERNIADPINRPVERRL